MYKKTMKRLRDYIVETTVTPHRRKRRPLTITTYTHTTQFLPNMRELLTLIPPFAQHVTEIR